MVKNINTKTDCDVWGTLGGTLPCASFPNNLTNVNGTLFFVANDGVNGAELWKSDGTEAGTVMVKNINTKIDCDAFGNPGAGTFPCPSNIDELINVNGTLFFVADDGNNGIELWKSDGTEAGTVMVDNRPGGDSSPSGLTNVNGTLFFAADDGANGIELWKLTVSSTTAVYLPLVIK